MGILQKIDRFFSGVEWKLSLGNLLWTFFFPLGSFALPAWGARAVGLFSNYAPLSWIIAGFVGLISYAMSIALIGIGRSRSVRARYDAEFMRESGGVDPMANVFESKRIFLGDFVLPSNPIIQGKTFVNCEIVGPANIYLHYGNGVDNPQEGLVDAVALSGERVFYNGIIARNCRFRACTFHRVTLFFHPNEVEGNQELKWLNWISPLPQQTMIPGLEPAAIENVSNQSDASKGNSNSQ
jgi:hypothetical protein